MKTVFRRVLLIIILVMCIAMPQAQAQKQEKEKPPQVLITNVNVWDGKSETLIKGKDVLVEGNLVKRIGKIDAPRATVIDGGGRTLMPGLIDAHVHLMLNDAPHVSIYEKPWAFVGAQAVAGAKAMLLRGFTTVRDVGGPVTGLKDAIDMGLVEGPRILPSGAFISQTSGHGDLETSPFKLSPYFTGIPDKSALFGWAFVADGVPEVQKAAREVLRTGATQIKVMAGGGVSSYFDPLHTTQYTFEELKAIVTEAAHWGTYVAAHSYTDAAVKQCVEAGVKSIEHGPFLTEETLKLMAEKDVWLSPQAYLFQMTPEDLSIMGTPAEPKMRQVNEDSDLVMKLAKKYKVKVAWGTDLFGPLEKQAQQPLEFKARTKYFSNFEILRQVTSDNAELLKLSGKLHPYQQGDLGVIQEGAYADLLLIDGNPLRDIEVMVNPAENFDLIMKDGKIHKNTL
jgi:imidazolonepropionase-like amidohydrolase